MSFNPTIDTFSGQIIRLSEKPEFECGLKAKENRHSKIGIVHYLGKMWRRLRHPCTRMDKVWQRMHEQGLAFIERSNDAPEVKMERLSKLWSNLEAFREKVVDKHNARRWKLSKLFGAAVPNDFSTDRMDALYSVQVDAYLNALTGIQRNDLGDIKNAMNFFSIIGLFSSGRKLAGEEINEMKNTLAQHVNNIHKGEMTWLKKEYLEIITPYAANPKEVDADEKNQDMELIKLFSPTTAAADQVKTGLELILRAHELNITSIAGIQCVGSEESPGRESIRVRNSQTGEYFYFKDAAVFEEYRVSNEEKLPDGSEIIVDKDGDVIGCEILPEDVLNLIKDWKKFIGV